jgi:REP element-mobilizing transposase RayT
MAKVKSMPETVRFYRRNLPHWLVAERTHFVTIRLHGTIPAQVVEELRAERESLLRIAATDERRQLDLQRRQFLRVEGILDACRNENAWLREPAVVKGVMGNLDWLRNRGWLLLAVVAMPNHMHMLMRNGEGRTADLLEDVGQFKNYTARVANRSMGRRGSFWAREDFDHWCRTPEKVESAVRYVRDNPVKAGMVRQWREWPWLVVDPAWESVTEHTPATS